MKKKRRFNYLLPFALALPFAAAAVVAAAMYGSDMLDLIMIALKMVVIA